MGDLMKKMNKATEELYDVYNVEVLVRDTLLGQIAESIEARLAKVNALVRDGYMPKEVADAILEDNRNRFRDMEIAKQQGEEAEEDAAEEAEKQMTNVFWRDVDGIYIEARVVKSALRDCLSQLGVFQESRGSKGTHNMGLYVEPDRVRFLRDNKVLQLADGERVAPVHVMTPQGPRSALVCSEYVKEVTMRFEIRLVRKKARKLTEDHLIKALALMQDAGFGGKRSQGFGKLSVTKLEKLEEKEARKVLRERPTRLPLICDAA